PPQRASCAPDRVGTAESHRAEHARIAAPLAKLACHAAIEAQREIVRTLVGPLRLGNGEQHPLDAAEQIAGGHVEHAQAVTGGLLHTRLTARCSKTQPECRMHMPGGRTSISFGIWHSVLVIDDSSLNKAVTRSPAGP